MSNKPETNFCNAVHKLLPKEVYREKMHNLYRGGTADMWYSGSADDLWVEYKYIKDPPKKAAMVIRKELSPLQILWLKGRYKEGRNVVVILGTPIGSWVFENLSWESAEVTTEMLKTHGLSKQAVADYISKRTLLCDSSRS